jgi:hypothetical protein
MPVRFLCEQHKIEWDDGIADEFVETQRLAVLLQECDGQPWAKEMHFYIDHLQAKATLKARTMRVYVKAAISLSASAQISNLGQLTQSDIEKFLRRKAGHSASLSVFCSWLESVYGVTLSPAKRKCDPIRAEKRLVLSLAHLLQKLKIARSNSEGRSLLAAILSKSFGVPLSRVLALKTNVVSIGPDGVILTDGSLNMLLEGELRDGFHRFISLDGKFLFPSRNSERPMSSDTVRYYTRQISAKRTK